MTKRFGPDQVHHAITRYDQVPDDQLPFEIVTGAANRVVDDFQAARIEDRSRIATLEQAQLIDAKTGLLNSEGYIRSIESAISLPEVRSGQAVAEVTVIDIDRFKTVNDTLGHPVGDELIVLAADVIARHSQRTSDVVAHGARDAAHLSGDEFAVVSVTPVNQADAMARRTIDAFGPEVTPLTYDAIVQDPFADLLNNDFQHRIAGTPFERVEGLRLSAGRAIYRPGDTAEGLHYQADAAMYVNKYGRRIDETTASVVTADDYARFKRDIEGIERLHVRKDDWLVEAETRITANPPMGSENQLLPPTQM